MSGPPISMRRLAAVGESSAATRQCSTSAMAMGWQRVWVTHRGQTITGSTSTRCRSISKEALPEPMITAARSSVSGTVPDPRIRPTSCRLAR